MPCRKLAAVLVAALTGGSFAAPALAQEAREAERPNVLLIMADDMGYSDIGPYGGEIPTPTLDKLAANGLRFSQFYNTARCCPTRASLMTGVAPHQAGIGGMTEEPGREADANQPAGYRGYLGPDVVTIAEALKPAGYQTFMTGKWHLGYHGEEKWPLARGFDRYYGIISGASSYFRPHGMRGLTEGNEQLPPPEDPDYYTTDAFADKLVEFIEERPDTSAPFFGYLAFNAPHWPLHAKQADIDLFVGKYAKGWDQLREERHQRQLEMGLLDETWALSPRDEGARAWDELNDKQKENLDFRMAVYAAQVYAMDRAIGRVVDALEAQGELENTLILFLSDNGACAEPGNDLGGGPMRDINNPDLWGPVSYGQGWANAGNTPFREFKRFLMEGGISTPLIASWPAGLGVEGGSITDAPGDLKDVMPTVLEITGASYPAERDGVKVLPVEGKSLVPVLKTGTREAPEWFFWEHFGERAVRHGDLKAHRDERTKEWALYDLATDRTELHDLAAERPEELESMVAAWQKWADTHRVTRNGDE